MTTIKCSKCGADKAPYHFHRGVMSKDFAPNYKEGQCWNCNGDYVCKGCNKTLPASKFRVQGRLCDDCRK